jgi:hypothetical protein
MRLMPSVGLGPADSPQISGSRKHARKRDIFGTFISCANPRNWQNEMMSAERFFLDAGASGFVLLAP